MANRHTPKTPRDNTHKRKEPPSSLASFERRQIEKHTPLCAKLVLRDDWKGLEKLLAKLERRLGKKVYYNTVSKRMWTDAY